MDASQLDAANETLTGEAPSLPPPHTPISLYLDLLKKILTRTALPEQLALWQGSNARAERVLRLARRAMNEPALEFARRIVYKAESRNVGKDWPSEAETMIGAARLDNLHACLEDVICREVPGDFIETGVWRGGATIFMRAAIKAHGLANRNVWVADSFEGLPKPDAEKYPADRGDKHWTHPELAVGVEQVKANFARYGLLDDQVKFLVGWFRDTLPVAPIEKLAIIRLDGDLYESTMDGLRNLYPKLSVGGYLIVDDYGCVRACKQAVTDFRAEHGIVEPIHEIDWTGVYWQRAARQS